MKILTCSDVHDDYEALAKFADYAQAKEADKIIVAGDLGLRPYSVNDLEKLAETKDVEKFLNSKREYSRKTLSEMKGILDKSGIEYLVLPGNYDDSKDLEVVFGKDNLHNKTTMLGDAKTAGYGGAGQTPQHIYFLHQFGENNDFDNEEVYSLLNSKKPNVVLTHNPPYQLCDNNFQGANWGSSAITQHILEDSPNLIICGHVHEAGPLGNNPHGVKGISGYQNEKTGKTTVVVNPGNLGRFELLSFPKLQTAMQLDFGTFSEIDMEKDGTPTNLKQYLLNAPNRKIGEVREIANISLK